MGARRPRNVRAGHEPMIRRRRLISASARTRCIASCNAPHVMVVHFMRTRWAGLAGRQNGVQTLPAAQSMCAVSVHSCASQAVGPPTGSMSAAGEPQSRCRCGPG